uniref:Uncharacterized protein n=1 Tax=Magallana gigas TaxID=29159 RepID=K1QIY9_MAGGI
MVRSIKQDRQSLGFEKYSLQKMMETLCKTQATNRYSLFAHRDSDGVSCESCVIPGLRSVERTSTKGNSKRLMEMNSVGRWRKIKILQKMIESPYIQQVTDVGQFPPGDRYTEGDGIGANQ